MQQQYVRPEKTYQEMISDEEIKKLLSSYIEVPSGSLLSIPIGTHIRYFSYDTKTGKEHFRIGGMLQSVDNKLRFLKLSNGKASWTAQIPTCRFYKKMGDDEYCKHVREEIKKETKDYINNLKNKIERLEKQVVELKQIKIAYDNLKK
jgi:hypothetical protein